MNRHLATLRLSTTTIPNICNFFDTGRIFESFIVHQKTTKDTANYLKIPLQKLKYAFLALNLEFLHRHRMWCLWQISGLATTSEIALEPGTKKSGNNIHFYSAFLFLQHDEKFFVWKKLYFEAMIHSMKAVMSHISYPYTIWVTCGRLL